MDDAIPPIVWGPEEEAGGVLLTWTELVLELVVLVVGTPDEVLEEQAATGARWDNRELSRDCSDRYGAGRPEGNGR